MSTFGILVKKILLDKGMSQRELAFKMGIAENNLSNILKRENIKTDTLKQIATALNCRLVIDLVPIDGVERNE